MDSKCFSTQDQCTNTNKRNGTFFMDLDFDLLLWMFSWRGDRYPCVTCALRGVWPMTTLQPPSPREQIQSYQSKYSFSKNREPFLLQMIEPRMKLAEIRCRTNPPYILLLNKELFWTTRAYEFISLLQASSQTVSFELHLICTPCTFSSNEHDYHLRLYT